MTIYRAKSNQLDWKPYMHENILSAQIDTIPLPYDLARYIVMEFLYEGVYNDISKYDGACFEGSGYRTKVIVNQDVIQVELVKKPEEQFLPAVFTSKVTHECDEYWYGQMEITERNVLRAFVISKNGKEIQSCKTDLDDPPYPFNDIL